MSDTSMQPNPLVWRNMTIRLTTCSTLVTMVLAAFLIYYPQEIHSSHVEAMFVGSFRGSLAIAGVGASALTVLTRKKH